MTEPAQVLTDDEIEALREAGDLDALVDALVRRGEDALEQGAWPDAQRDLDEAAELAMLAALPELAARARHRAAIAYRADGQPRSAAIRSPATR